MRQISLAIVLTVAVSLGVDVMRCLRMGLSLYTLRWHLAAMLIAGIAGVGLTLLILGEG